ncbi:MAG: 2-phospho-L-lactate transferase [Chloroflexi bacterium]|nr:2-phospho-L-lactate transferase [Chloroflexota bacterium]
MISKVVALAGGVGGAKLADGLYRCLAPGDLSVIVNTADDFVHYGLNISPDLDTVCYALAGLANPETGWGREGETWQAIHNAVQLGGPDWFNLGDRDLGTHLERTRRLRQGDLLSEITSDFARAWGISANIFPMSNDLVATMVSTVDDGELPFQEYFVKRGCEPRVTGFRFAGIETARPAPFMLEAIEGAQVVVICPSNPWVSIRPILDIPGIRQQIQGKHIVAVSPIIGGKAVKGPAAKMYTELGMTPSASTVAGQYGSLLSGFVLDRVDGDQTDKIRQSGIISFATNTLMSTAEDRERLASEVLDFCDRIIGGK